MKNRWISSGVAVVGLGAMVVGLAGPAFAGSALTPKGLKALEKTLKSGSGQTYLARTTL